MGCSGPACGGPLIVGVRPLGAPRQQKPFTLPGWTDRVAGSALGKPNARRSGRRVARDTDIADDVISGSLKRSQSYHSDYGKKTYKVIKDWAAATPPDQKARQMRKQIEQTERLREKGKGRRS